MGVTVGNGSGTGVGVPVGVPVGDGSGEGVGVTVGVGVSCDLAAPSIREIFAEEFIEYARADNKMTNDNITANNRFILMPRFLEIGLTAYSHVFAYSPDERRSPIVN